MLADHLFIVFLSSFAAFLYIKAGLDYYSSYLGFLSTWFILDVLYFYFYQGLPLSSTYIPFLLFAGTAILGAFIGMILEMRAFHKKFLASID